MQSRFRWVNKRAYLLASVLAEAIWTRGNVIGEKVFYESNGRVEGRRAADA